MVKTENTNLGEPELGLGHNRDVLLRLGHPFRGSLLFGTTLEGVLSRPYCHECISIDPFFNRTTMAPCSYAFCFDKNSKTILKKRKSEIFNLTY